MKDGICVGSTLALPIGSKGHNEPFTLVVLCVWNRCCSPRSFLPRCFHSSVYGSLVFRVFRRWSCCWTDRPWRRQQVPGRGRPPHSLPPTHSWVIPLCSGPPPPHAPGVKHLRPVAFSDSHQKRVSVVAVQTSRLQNGGGQKSLQHFTNLSQTSVF